MTAEHTACTPGTCRATDHHRAVTCGAGGDAQALAAVEAVARVEALADEYDRHENWRTWRIGSSIRAALRPEGGDQ
ncbi:hypothetical protein LRP67_16385 [Nocardioides sp. cx-169]|uniref:hypothetical protein n=1 Tax=Nocardioides sp. cx-169 TaxID=2899080 RepID=UPI001E303B17|nr:hypothetical protein [Nocardioides sp. cx-169]MCD4535672.1 hypothetical protein [Nocardioides sp. cx-169]